MNESPELVLDGGNSIRQQIEGQIRWLVRSGDLRPGEELPTVRAVAVGLAVSPRAVEQAYNQLEKECVLTWADSSAPRVTHPPTGQRDADLKRLCVRFLRQATGSGYPRAAILHMIQTYLQEELPPCSCSRCGTS
jgi:GntR family transcriptional regulator